MVYNLLSFSNIQSEKMSALNKSASYKITCCVRVAIRSSHLGHLATENLESLIYLIKTNSVIDVIFIISMYQKNLSIQPSLIHDDTHLI